MKGPQERLKYDLRRVWECPVCRHRERTSGQVTSLWCACQSKAGPSAVTMRLVEDGVRRVDGAELTAVHTLANHKDHGEP